MGLGAALVRAGLGGLGRLPDRTVRGLTRRLFARSWRRFDRACEDPVAAQTTQLRRILDRAAQTEFGRVHGFADVTDFEGYRARVPVRDHAGFLPWLDRVAAGEPDVLVPGRPSFLGRSSGTTGRPKLIPVTPAYRAEFRRPRRVWACQMVEAFPGLLRGRVLAMHSPLVEGRSPGGIPFGSVTVGLTTRPGRPEAALRDGLLDAVPRGVFALDDFELKYQAAVRFALQAPVSLVAAINPSTLVLLAQTLETCADRLEADLRSGGFFRQEALPRALRCRLRPAAAVADRLAASVRAHGYPVWTEVFPELVGMACWKGGSAPFYLGQLGRWFPGIEAMDYGFLATEGGFTFPLSPDRPGGVVAVTGHVLEFVPADEAAEGCYEGARLADALEPGARYRVLVTGSHGLYRYDIDDVVECTGRYRRTAEVAFVGKGGLVSSVTGEKLTEAHASAAAEQASAALGIPLSGVVLGLELGSPPAYTWGIEPSGALAPGDGDALVARLEAALREQNGEYAAKRASGRLGPPRWVELARGSFAAERSRRVAAGAPDAHVKLPHLAPDPEQFAAWLARARVGATGRGG